MSPGIPFEPASGLAFTDFNPGSVVAAGRAAHYHALALAVHHRFVPADAAQQLPEPRDRSRDQRRSDVLLTDCREPLWIVRDHGFHPRIDPVDRDPGSGIRTDYGLP